MEFIRSLSFERSDSIYRKCIWYIWCMFYPHIQYCIHTRMIRPLFYATKLSHWLWPQRLLFAEDFSGNIMPGHLYSSGLFTIGAWPPWLGKGPNLAQSPIRWGHFLCRIVIKRSSGQHLKSMSKHVSSLRKPSALTWCLREWREAPYASMWNTESW